MKAPTIVIEQSLEIDDYIDGFDENISTDEIKNGINEKESKDHLAVKLREKPRDNNNDTDSRKAPTMIIEAKHVGRPIKVLSFISNAAVVIFFFLSTSGANWMLTTNLRVGLWEECVYITNRSIFKFCNRNPCFKGYVQVFVISCMMALILTLLTTILIAVGMKQLNLNRKMRIYNIVIVTNMISVLLFLVALIGYPISFLKEAVIANLIHAHGQFWGIGWSYVMGWLGVIMAGISTGLLYYDKSSEEIIYYEKISKNSYCNCA